MFQAFAFIFLVGLAGGLVPLMGRWSDRQHHRALAFSAGIFLGAVFLHLLPTVAAEAAADGHGHAHVEAPAEDPHAGHDHGPADGHDHGAHDHDHDHGHDHGASDDPHAGHSHGPIGPWLWVLAGVLGVFLIEALLIPGSTHGHGHASDDASRHRAVGFAALLGLTVHALTAGVALAAVQGQGTIAGVMLLAIVAHKGFESFSLASVFSLAGLARGRTIALIVAFSLVTPLGLLLGTEITGALGAGGVSILTALATGTFLYVCLCELLPEVFHRREDGPLKIALLAVGVGGMWWAHSVGGI